MELLTKQVPNDFNLFLISDDHEGNAMRYNRGWDVMVDMVNSSWNGLDETRNYIVELGDFCEGLLIDHPYYRPETVTQSITALQILAAIDHRKHIKHKILAILDGNHPMRLWKYDYMTQRLCYELGVPFGSLQCKISFVSEKGNKLMFKGFFTHGRKGISSVAGSPKRRETNMLIKLQDLLWQKASDCYIMARAHTHKLLILPPTPETVIYDEDREEHHDSSTSYIDQAAQYIHKDDRWYVSTGSFLKLRDATKRMVYIPPRDGAEGVTMPISSYAEAADYDPLDLGFAIAEVRDRRLVQVRKVSLTGKVEIEPSI